MTLLPESWIQTLGWTLVHSLWILTLLALGLRLLLWVIPRSFSRFRYSTSVVVLILAFVALAVTGHRVHEHKGINTVSPTITLTSEMPALHQSASAAQPADSWMQSVRQTSRQLHQWLSPHLSGMLVLWFSGVLFFLLRTVGKVAYLHRLTLTDTCPLPDGWEAPIMKLKNALNIRRYVLIRASMRVRTPFVVGLFKPVILLPLSSFTQLSYEQMEAILAHELAHIRRWDDVINWLQTVVEIILFYHPAIWWISQSIRDEREKCCDDVAVAACGNALVYAKALAHMETLQQSTPDLVLAFARRGAGLLARIERLLQPTTAASQASVAPAVVTGLLLLSFLLSYRMTASFSTTAEATSGSYYSSAILSIPRLQDAAGDIPATRSPWQPTLPDWLLEEELLSPDTVPPTPEEERQPEGPDKEEQDWYQFHSMPALWAAEVDTLLPRVWEFTDSMNYLFLPSMPDMVDIPMIGMLTDSSIVWKSDSAFRFQINGMLADTLFPPNDLNGILNIPMPPMPDILLMPDSLRKHSLHLYEDAFRNYEKMFEQLDSSGFWDQLAEQEHHLEEQQRHYEEQLREHEAQYEQQLREWEQRLEAWERRQEEQLRHYEERVRAWEERTQEQLRRQEECYREQREQQD